MNVHVDIPTFKAFVQTKFLYNMDEAYEGKASPCKVFAVSSYKGHYPTFKILLDDGSLFDYIPAHALFVKPNNTKYELGIDDLCYGKACPDFNIAVSVHQIFSEPYAIKSCWFPKKNIWVDVDRYICTIDWYKDNENANLLILKNGQIAFVPNHKMLLAKTGPVATLPKYKAIKSEWKP